MVSKKEKKSNEMRTDLETIQENFVKNGQVRIDLMDLKNKVTEN